MSGICRWEEYDINLVKLCSNGQFIYKIQLKIFDKSEYLSKAVKFLI